MSETRPDVHLDHTALEDVVTMLRQHLSLRGMDNVAEIHVWGHRPFERHFHAFRDWHRGLTSGQRQSNSPRVCSECYTF